MTTIKARVAADLDTFFTKEERRIRSELDDFLRIPSVSARSEHNGDTARCADWLADRIRAIGMTATVHSTPGHPIVVGEWRNAGPSAPTVLVYGHYDVQPVEPLDLWTSPPFEPTVRDGKLYARGSVDDKGQLFIHVKAAEALLKQRGKLPVNLVLLAEGEEEVGSDNLAAFVEKNAELLRADSVVISDSSMFAPGQPSILSSLRGIAYMQIDVVGPSHDLHSGSYGGAVVNPAMALARILATMHDKKGRVTIKGFYDKVRKWDKKSRNAILRIGAKQEGIFRNHVVCASGRIRDSVWFSIIDSEWPHVKAALEAKLASRASMNRIDPR